MSIRWFPCKSSDATGAILNAGPPCNGFMLCPGVPSKNDPSVSNAKLRPGSFPVRVRERGPNNIIPVRNSHSFYFGSEFRAFDILDVENGDCWDVFAFDTREDGIMLSGRKRTVPVRIQDVIVLAAADPALATDGWPLRPGMTSITTYFGGTARANTLWVRFLDGTWFNTLEVVDQTAAGAVAYDTRELKVPGDRFAWRPNGAGQQVIVEAEMEVG